MSLIPFPSHIKPARLTAQLRRVDESMISPLTNIQQIAVRGNPVWVWTLEYTDVTDSERDIVQAFLLKCRGSINTFKISDPGEYSISGNVSNWIDVFSGFGSFNTLAGSSSVKVNSWWGKTDRFAHHITDEQLLRYEWLDHEDVPNMYWFGEGSNGKVSSLDLGKAYVQRIKHFQNPNKSAHGFSFQVGSGSSRYVMGSGPFPVFSSGIVSAPFYVAEDVSSFNANMVEWKSNGGVGDHWQYTDYRLARCALVANSEQLFTRSNNFGHADWTKTRASVVSGFAEDPAGGNNYWRFHVNSDEATGTHFFSQTITKQSTEDIYTTGLYLRKGLIFNTLRLEMNDSLGASALIDFNVASETATIVSVATFIRPFGKLFDVGSGFFRLQGTAQVSSASGLTANWSVVNTDGSVSFATVDTAYFDIFGASLRKFPFMGPYVPSTDTIVVGSGWQTGSNLYVDGFDPQDIIKSGQRFEVINQFHNNSSDLFERSEFKRLTTEIKAHREGYAILEFDPPIRNAPVTDRSYNTGENLGETMHNLVIFHKPELKARLVAGTIQYVDKPLMATDIIFNIMEDLSE